MKHLAALLLLASLLSGCGASNRALFRVLLADDAVLPALTSLAWLASEDEPDEGRFISATSDGLLREWDIYTGLVSVFELQSWLSDGRAAAGIRSAVHGSPLKDGKKLVASEDGCITLVNAATGKELARYYGFDNGEWVSIGGEGFYNASLRGASFLALEAKKTRYRLDQLSSALFRPDLFSALLLSDLESAGNPPLPLTAGTLFREDRQPPLVSFIPGNDGRKLIIQVVEQKGGAGSLALYSHRDGEKIPIGLFDVKAAADLSYTEKGKTFYELTLDFFSAELFSAALGRSPVWINQDDVPFLGVSVFNEYNTIESTLFLPELGERQNLNESITITPPEASSGTDRDLSKLPVLRVFLASEEPEHIKTLSEFFTYQAEGDLYTRVEIQSISGNEYSLENFAQALGNFRDTVNNGDVVILYIAGTGQVDDMGKLSIAMGKVSEDAEISELEMLQAMFALPLESTLFLLDMSSLTSLAPLTSFPQPASLPSPLSQAEAMQTALLRFRQRLGPRAMIASSLPMADDGAFIRAVMEGLGPDFTSTAARDRFIGARKLLSRAEEALTRQGALYLASYPRADFSIADSLINAGELKFQTMASGMLRIDPVDKNAIPLNFGITMTRALPAGRYTIEMTYRNGYRERRTVDLPPKASTWVIFNYTPALLSDASAAGRLSSLGINVAELNPANYEKINQEAMEGMGMAPYYVAFLAGEKYYREGSYDRAIAEYNRAISLKADYADAFASRGNAQRRKGDLARAIDDYSRALSYNGRYAEVFNYRGYVYAQRGDLARAITDYTQAIRNKADYADAYFNRAYAYGKQGSWDLAIADYTQVLRIEPQNALAFKERGNAYTGKGDERRAAADYASAERLNGKS